MQRLILLCLLLLCVAVPLSAQDNPTPYEIALQRIEAARLSGSTELDLYDLRLSALPPEIGNLTNLEVLLLDSNQLSTLPLEIGSLSNLQWLYLDNNQLRTLPSQIGNLTNLQGLDLHNNQLNTLPPEIGLTNLQWLYLQNNQLSALPPEIGSLTNLQWLDLYNNQLSTLPSQIGQLYSLCYLNLSDNNLYRLPSQFGQLTLLETGADCGNAIGIGLFLDGNPLVSPPPEVVAQGTGAVLEYLRHQAWYHIQKLILSASGGVGLLAILMLGFRYKQRGARKPKKKRDAA